MGERYSYIGTLHFGAEKNVGVRRAARLEDIPPSDEELREYEEIAVWHERSEITTRGRVMGALRATEEEMKDDKEIAEWERFSDETGHELILGDPEDLEENEKLALVRKYAPGVRGRARVFDKKSGKYMRSFYDSETKKHYIYRPHKMIFELDVKTGKEILVSERQK